MLMYNGFLEVYALELNHSLNYVVIRSIDLARKQERAIACYRLVPKLDQVFASRYILDLCEKLLNYRGIPPLLAVLSCALLVSNYLLDLPIYCHLLMQLFSMHHFNQINLYDWLRLHKLWISSHEVVAFLRCLCWQDMSSKDRRSCDLLRDDYTDRMDALESHNNRVAQLSALLDFYRKTKHLTLTASKVYPEERGILAYLFNRYKTTSVQKKNLTQKKRPFTIKQYLNNSKNLYAFYGIDCLLDMLQQWSHYSEDGTCQNYMIEVLNTSHFFHLDLVYLFSKIHEWLNMQSELARILHALRLDQRVAKRHANIRPIAPYRPENVALIILYRLLLACIIKKVARIIHVKAVKINVSRKPAVNLAPFSKNSLFGLSMFKAKPAIENKSATADPRFLRSAINKKNSLRRFDLLNSAATEKINALPPRFVRTRSH